MKKLRAFVLSAAAACAMLVGQTAAAETQYVMEPLMDKVYTAGATDSSGTKYTHSIIVDRDDFPAGVTLVRDNIWRVDFDGSDPVRVSNFIPKWSEIGRNRERGIFYTGLKKFAGEAEAKREASYFIYQFKAGYGTPFSYKVLRAETGSGVSDAIYKLPRSLRKFGPYDKIVLPQSEVGKSKMVVTGRMVRSFTDARNKLFLSTGGMKVTLKDAKKVASNAGGDFYKFPNGELVVTHRGNLNVQVR